MCVQYINARKVIHVFLWLREKKWKQKRPDARIHAQGMI